MSRPRPAALFFGLGLVLALIAAAELMKGGFFISKHEGDTLHFMDMILRMAAGERIHRDFSTPLGVLTVAPFALLVRLGLPGGTALIGGQLIVAALLLPLVAWITASRLPRLAAWPTGFYLVILCVALVHGETDASISMSMSYNRWAWLLAYLALLPALLPLSTPRGQSADGAVIGLAMAALVLLKITYFVALALPVALALVLRRSWRSLGTATLAGAGVALAATLWGGFGYWTGYVADLRAVAATPLRSWPGQGPGNLMGGPAFLGVNLMLLLGVVLLRQAGRRVEGLVLLLLLPAFIYIVLQNFGNDPQWLILLAAVLLALMPAEGIRNGWGWDLRRAMQMAVVASLAFAAPSFLNLAYSPWRHLWLDAAQYVPLVPDNAAFADLGLERKRYAQVNVNTAMDGEGTGLERFRQFAERDRIAVSVNGEMLPLCELGSGLEAWFDTVAADLEASGYAGRRIWQADLFNFLWLFGDFPPLRGVAPWYYGGTPGLADADLVLIPDCAIAPDSRKAAVEALAAAGYGLTEIRRTPLYRLFRLDRPAGDGLAGG